MKIPSTSSFPIEENDYDLQTDKIESSNALKSNYQVSMTTSDIRVPWLLKTNKLVVHAKKSDAADTDFKILCKLNWFSIVC